MTDSNAALEGVADDPWAMAYVPPLAAAADNRVTALQVENPSTATCVSPTVEQVQDGHYAPLTWPLLVYPSTAVLERPEVRAFVEFHLTEQDAIATDAGYLPSK